MALKKSQLYSSLWQSCDELRGGMDASQYKDYVQVRTTASRPLTVSLPRLTTSRASDQADFNDESKIGTGREMQDRLSKLVAIFEGLDFRANRAEGDDLLRQGLVQRSQSRPRRVRALALE